MEREFNDLVAKVEVGEYFYGPYLNTRHKFGGVGEGDYKYGYHGLMLQAWQGDTKLTQSPTDKQGAFSYGSHKKCEGMSQSEAMQRYVELLPKLANDPEIKNAPVDGV